MTIERGRPWGTTATVPADAVRVPSDADFSALPAGTCAIVTGGDLWDATGRPCVGAAGTACTLVPIDALECTITWDDGSTTTVVAVSRVEVGTWMRPGHRYVCVTNAGMVDGANLAPRAHPNDGRLDVLEVSASMPWRQRAQARRRSRTGSHLPHPDISVAQSATVNVTRRVPHERLVLDGTVRPTNRSRAAWVSVTVAVLPDHWRLVL